MESIEIALVEEPAIEVDFLKFNSEKQKLEFNEDKMIVKGAVMIPEKMLYRNDRFGERFVTYDANEIQKAAMLFLKNGMKFNQSHSSIEASLDIYESYIAAENNELDVPIGSWIIAAKVKDNALWQEIKNGTFNGFSLQGMFSNELIGTQELNFNNTKMDLKEKLQAAINAVLFGETSVETKVVEEFAAPVEAPVEDAPVEVEVETPEVNTLSEEKVQEMIDNAVMSATEQIMSAVQELVNQGKESQVAMSAMKTQLEEFSKQPLTQPITETVNNIPTESGYSYLQGIKLN